MLSDKHGLSIPQAAPSRGNLLFHSLPALMHCMICSVMSKAVYCVSALVIVALFLTSPLKIEKSDRFFHSFLHLIFIIIISVADYYLPRYHIARSASPLYENHPFLIYIIFSRSLIYIYFNFLFHSPLLYAQ